MSYINLERHKRIMMEKYLLESKLGKKVKHRESSDSFSSHTVNRLNGIS